MSTTTLTLTSEPAARTRPSTLRAAWLGLLVVLASSVMDLLDSTIAQTAAPAIRRSLGGSYADLEWITAAYTLSMSATLMLGSRLGDMLGRRRVLLGGIGGFVGASALCALAPTATTLIAGRAVQGVTAAMMVPQGFGLIRELFGSQGQQKALGVLGPVMGLAAVAGPLVGGGLIALDLLGTGWRAIFLVNVPLGIAAIVAGRRFLPAGRPSHPGARPDVLSVALAMADGIALVYPLIRGARRDGPRGRSRSWPRAPCCWRRSRRGRARARHGRAPLVEPSILRCARRWPVWPSSSPSSARWGA